MTTKQQAIETETITMATDIIVIGEGYRSLYTASQISKNGYNVILARQANDHFSTLGVPSSELDRLTALENDIANNNKIEIFEYWRTCLQLHDQYIYVTSSLTVQNRSSTSKNKAIEPQVTSSFRR